MRKWCFFLLLVFPPLSLAQSVEEMRRIMNSQSTKYEVLGVKRNATAEEIRAASRRLMKIYHPDRFQKDPQKFQVFSNIMKQINVSRELLLDPAKRQKYDSTVWKNSAPQKSQSKYQATANQEKWANAKKWAPEEFEKSKKNPQSPGTTTQHANQAKKAYEATAKCGTGYFKNFVDVFL